MSWLSFDEAGHGAMPLVFIHGWCCRRSHMVGLFEEFAGSHRVYALDLPGHGETPPVDGPATFAVYAQTVADFLVQHDLENAVLIGHSMGGVLSVLAAGFVPERVVGVVNLDGALPLHPAAREGYRTLFAEVERVGFRAVMEPFLRKAFFLPDEMGPMAEEILADMLNAPESLAVELLSQFPTLDADKILKACPVPLLYVGSSRPRFDEVEVARLRPDIEMARTAISGHFVQTFAMLQVAAMIRQFLRMIRAR